MSLIDRMVEDMQIRHFSPSTVAAYTCQIKSFAKFLGKELDAATAEDIRRYQVHLVQDRKLSWNSFNQSVCGLRFLYRITHPMPWAVDRIPYAKPRRRVPTVLDSQEVEALLSCTPNLKQRTILTTLYATGLRVSEVVELQIPDIDSRRMELRVNHGKGRKQRMVPISPRLLTELRDYWKEYRPQDYLFPGTDPKSPYKKGTIQMAIKRIARRAKITKKVTPHTLRHSYATALLEAGVDVLVISRLLGHTSLMTTMIYLHVRRPHLKSTPSPLDWLPVRQCPLWTQKD